MNDVLIRLKVILNVITKTLQVIGLGLFSFAFIIEVISIVGNLGVPYFLQLTVIGFGIFLAGYIIDKIINY